MLRSPHNRRRSEPWREATEPGRPWSERSEPGEPAADRRTTLDGDIEDCGGVSGEHRLAGVSARFDRAIIERARVSWQVSIDTGQSTRAKSPSFLST